jgi:hypothetical protein
VIEKATATTTTTNQKRSIAFRNCGIGMLYGFNVAVVWLPSRCTSIVQFWNAKAPIILRYKYVTAKATYIDNLIITVQGELLMLCSGTRMTTNMQAFQKNLLSMQVRM